MIIQNDPIKTEFLKLFRKSSKLILIHRGSRDSFEKKKFHENIHGKGPYVFLIKSEKNIFGGYTDLKIPTDSGCEKGNSFLFKLNLD